MYIELNKLTKTYKMGDITITAADKVSFGIEKGELAVVLGPSGAGKTTVLNILGGMDRCDSGTITIDDKDISKYSNYELTKYRRNDIGFIFQFYNLVQNLTALENIELTNQICNDTLPAKEVLASVGLEDRMNNFPAQLSGGEQQRVAIARALAKKPRLLLCDEPTGALDYQTGKQILALLQRQSRENGMTVVIITHNSALTAMADRVIRVKSGQITGVRCNEAPVPVESIEW